MFKFFKKLFKKSVITAPAKSEKYSVFMSNAPLRIKLFSKIEVKPEYEAVVVSNNKVLDILKEGTFELTTAILPYTTRKFKLDKPDKKHGGGLPTDFVADIYYVHKTEFHDVKFQNVYKVPVRDKNFLKCKVGFKAIYSYRITNSEDYLNALFYEFPTIKGNMAQDQLSYWVSEYVCKKIEKNKPELEKLYARDSECFADMVEYLNKQFYDIGVEILSVEIKEVILPKKVYKKTQLVYTENVLGNPSMREKQDNLEQMKQIENQTTSTYLYKSDVSNNQIQAEQNNVTTSENVIKLEQTVSPVQLNLKTIEFKTCKKCGSMSPKDAEFCFKCGNRLKD